MALAFRRPAGLPPWAVPLGARASDVDFAGETCLSPGDALGTCLETLYIRTRRSKAEEAPANQASPS
jgi:hypothetical protein